MELPGDDKIRRVSMVDNVTERLRRALLAGDIKPGERIKVAALEKSLGVSHIPIREAVRRLETEGLIVTLPQRAAVAAAADLDDLAGLYGLRRIIECGVIRRSVESMTDEQVERVRSALDALEAVAQDHGSPAFWELHAASDARDADRAEEVLRRHLDRTEQAVRRAFVSGDGKKA